MKQPLGLEEANAEPWGGMEGFKGPKLHDTVLKTKES